MIRYAAKLEHGAGVAPETVYEDVQGLSQDFSKGGLHWVVLRELSFFLLEREKTYSASSEDNERHEANEE